MLVARQKYHEGRNGRGQLAAHLIVKEPGKDISFKGTLPVPPSSN
jgi:hypothetical protein